MQPNYDKQNVELLAMCIDVRSRLMAMQKYAEFGFDYRMCTQLGDAIARLDQEVFKITGVNLALSFKQQEGQNKLQDSNRHPEGG